ncbi:MAG: alpha/beta fold hydrolase [Chitinophagales bacterium]|nr:alpha/beta fold hydrolase [Chitinophagales bacterium]
MQLNYKQFGEGFPLIILHGLFGSLDNWQTIAKRLAENLRVFIIDQRNHGKSAHSKAFNYDLLAADLAAFMYEHQLPKAHIIGHSMGGKTAMKFALLHPENVDKLVVVDISPSAYDDKHHEVFNALFAAHVEQAQSRESVEKILREKLSDEATVLFLMKNLTRNENGTGFRWKFNVESLFENYAAISGAITSAKPFAGETLFIKGEHSNYINASNYSNINSLFPHHQLSEIKGAGHWVHADKPEEFVNEVKGFLQQ